MENCSICNSDYKKAYKSDHINSIGHQKKLGNIIVKIVIYICPYQVSLVI